jgi:hypothetical protein
VAIEAISRAIQNLAIPDLLTLDAARAVISSDGRVLVAHDNDAVSVWDLPAFVDSVEDRPEALSADGRFRVVAERQTNGQCGGDGNELCETWMMMRLFDERSGTQIDALRGPTSSLPDVGPVMVEFDPQDRVVVTRPPRWLRPAGTSPGVGGPGGCTKLAQA